MLKSASRLAEVYKDTLDTKLLYAGVILHDIGKIKELECNVLGSADYTSDGNLLGHLFIGAEMVSEYAKKYDLGEIEERLLKHMIVSHHGKREFGAIALPAIPEAMLLHHIDCMDAEIYQYEEVRKNMKADSMSDRVFGLNDVHVYKPY